MLAARRLAVLLGLTAILALPSSGGAAAPSGGAAELRQRDTSLAAKERAATQELYSLEAQLAVARSRLAALSDQREDAEARLTRLRIELDVAWQSAYIAEEHLGARIRQLYQRGSSTRWRSCSAPSRSTRRSAGSTGSAASPRATGTC